MQATSRRLRPPQASPTRRCPHQSQRRLPHAALIRESIASFRIRSSQLPSAPLSRRPAQRIAALIREPIASFRIRSSQLPRRAERPLQPQRIAALIRAPIASFRIRSSQLPRRAERPPQPQRITASNRAPIASFRIRPSQLPRRAERPPQPQRISASNCAPIASFRIRPSQFPRLPHAHPSASPPPSRRFAFALRRFPAAPLAPSSAIPVILRPSPCRFSRLGSPGAYSDSQKTENRAETFIPARNRSVCRLRTPAPGRRTGRATCARSAADRPPD